VSDKDSILKIVHIITRLILGGAQENTLITCKLLAERGHDVTLITGPAIGPEGELVEQTKNQKYKTIVVDKLRRPICPIYDTISYRQIKSHLREIQPDIVHTHSAKAGILGRFAAYNLRHKTKDSGGGFDPSTTLRAGKLTTGGAYNSWIGVSSVSKPVA